MVAGACAEKGWARADPATRDAPIEGKVLARYCYQGGEALCPNWVTFSTINPGVTNPYRSSSLSVDTYLSAEESSELAEILSSDEIVALDVAVDLAEPIGTVMPRSRQDQYGIVWVAVPEDLPTPEPPEVVRSLAGG